MKKTFSIGCIVLLLLALTGAFSSIPILAEDEEQPLYGGTLRVGYHSDPKSFTGFLHYWTSTQGITRSIYNGLLRWNKDYDISPDLAESYEVTTDGKKYTFHLYSNVTWHDGRPFTSEDVKFHFEVIAGMRTDIFPGGTPSSKNFMNLVSIETPDDYTVIFNFNATVLPSIFAGGQGDMYITAKHVYDVGIPIQDNPAKMNPVGTGPFKLLEYVTGDYTVLVANENYFKGRPYLDKIIFKVYPKATTALMALEAGEIDNIVQGLIVPLSELPRLREDPKYDVQVIDHVVVWRLLFNQREEAVALNPWVADLNVRKAFGHAIDIPTIVSRVLFGATHASWGPITNVVAWAHDPDLPKIPYDPEEAERLLDEAGYPRGSDGVRFTAELPYTTREAYSDQCLEVICEMLSEVGIEITLIPMEKTIWLNTYWYSPTGFAEYPVSYVKGGTGPDPMSITNLYHSEFTPDQMGGMNGMWYSNSRVDELLILAQTTPDQDIRQEYYYEIADILNEDLPVLWLWNDFKVEVWNAELFKGFREDFSVCGPIHFHGDYAKVWWTKGIDLSPVIDPGPGPDTTDLESRIDTLESSIQSLSSDISSLESQVDAIPTEYDAPDMTMSYIAVLLSVIAIGLSLYIVTKAK